MKVVQINSSCTKGSTGKVCIEISKVLTQNGIENYILHAQSDSDYPLGISYCNEKYIKIQSIKSRILGNYGFNSGLSTKRLINNLKEIKPDVVHIHNIHTHECNIGILLNYLKEKKIKVFWTFHDCWAFTGYCPHFDYIQCSKWKTECHACPQRLSKSIFFDRSRQLYRRKKEITNGLDLNIFTPSEWLSDLVGESFLRDYPRTVINNGIDLEIFNPKENRVKERHNISGKMILGVSYIWDKSKGIDVFIELRKRLSNEYTILLVGVDKKTERLLPDGIIAVGRTNSAEELAEYYSACDVFVNPTREDTYPTVNMEAIACGAPIVTFKTGGSPEIIDSTCGIAVPRDDIDRLEAAVHRVCKEKPFDKEAFKHKAEEFDRKKSFRKYLAAYEGLLSI